MGPFISAVVKAVGTEATMRVFIVLAVAVAVGVIGFGLKTAFTPGSPAQLDSINRAVAASNALWPMKFI